MIVILSFVTILFLTSAVHADEWQGRIEERDGVAYVISPSTGYQPAETIGLAELWHVGDNESKLEEIFGEEWRSWSRNIPAMLPTRLKWQSSQDSEWDVHQSMIRNGELLYTIFEIGAAVLLWYRAAS